MLPSELPSWLETASLRGMCSDRCCERSNTGSIAAITRENSKLMQAYASLAEFRYLKLARGKYDAKARRVFRRKLTRRRLGAHFEKALTNRQGVDGRWCGQAVNTALFFSSLLYPPPPLPVPYCPVGSLPAAISGFQKGFSTPLGRIVKKLGPLVCWSVAHSVGKSVGRSVAKLAGQI